MKRKPQKLAKPNDNPLARSAQRVMEQRMGVAPPPPPPAAIVSPAVPPLVETPIQQTAGSTVVGRIDTLPELTQDLVIADGTYSEERVPLVSRQLRSFRFPGEAFRVRVDEDTARTYEQQASAASVAPEDVMADRLRRCVTHTADKPLYIDDDQRRSLEQLLGVNFNSAAELVSRVARLVQVTGDSLPVLQFSPQQLERVASRCAYGETFAEKLQEFCNYGINANTGLA